MNLHKTCLQKVFLFHSSLRFWIICLTTVLSIQMLVQHFSGGYSIFACRSVWAMLWPLWNMNPLINGEQPGAKPCMSEQQLHSCRRGEELQGFWSRLSVADSFLLINPAPGTSQQFCVRIPFLGLSTEGKGCVFIRTWLWWCSTACLCSCFQITSSFLSYAMILISLIEVSTYELIPCCLCIVVLCFSALDPVKWGSLRAVDVVQVLVCCLFQVRSFH